MRECQVLTTTSWRLNSTTNGPPSRHKYGWKYRSNLVCHYWQNVSSVKCNILPSVQRLRYGLDNRRNVVRFPAGATDFSALSTKRTSAGLTQSAIQCELREQCHGVKRPGRDADYHFHLGRSLRNGKPKRPLPHTTSLRAKGQLYL
jgi:hypothetical protein